MPNLKNIVKKNALPFLHANPPKWLTSNEYIDKFGGKWYEGYPRTKPKYRTPTLHGKYYANLLREVISEIPETGVLELRNALVFGGTGRIFTREGYLLPDHSWYRDYVDEIKEVPGSLWQKLARIAPSTKRLKGVCLSLHSDFAVGSYAHFLLDALSRLGIFYKAGLKLSDVDYIICPKPPSKNAQNLFSKLSLPEDKCIFVKNNTDTVLAEVLLAPTFPGIRKNYAEWVPDFIRHSLLPPSPLPTKRLYISRSGFTRNVLNEKEIFRILSKYGFENYDPRHHENQHKDFAEAEIVVGPHGGGLTNLVFCCPGTKVLELIPNNYVYPYFYTLSNASNLDYRYMVCPGDKKYPHHIYVDETEFEKALKLALV
jgi:capsular polysaccharide biosynthesis protein